MHEDSLWTPSGTEGRATPALVEGSISQSQVEPSREDQSKETQDEVFHARERKMTAKGKCYQIEILHRNRATRYTALSKEISQAYHILEQSAELGELERQRDILDRQRDQFNEAH